MDRARESVPPVAHVLNCSGPAQETTPPVFIGSRDEKHASTVGPQNARSSRSNRGLIRRIAKTHSAFSRSGACFSGGHLLRGARSLAGAFGHFAVVPDGDPCSCRLKGCLECYAGAAALVRYANGTHEVAESMIRAAHAGDDNARRALTRYAGYLAAGIATITQILDPETVILSGGVAQSNDLLLMELGEQVPRRILTAGTRRMNIVRSELGYFGGVYGAGAVARDRVLLS